MDGSRITRIVDGNLSIARRVEAKIKTDVTQRKNLGILSSPIIIGRMESILRMGEKQQEKLEIGSIPLELARCSVCRRDKKWMRSMVPTFKGLSTGCMKTAVEADKGCSPGDN